MQCFNCETEFAPGSLGLRVAAGEYADCCPTCGMHFATPPLPREEFDEVVADGSELQTYQLPREEVRRRLPPIDRLADRDIAHAVIDLTAEAPAYFWRVPASKSEYHHPLCRGEHGLWVHTLMGVTALERLLESRVHQGLLDSYEADCARAAQLLHDQRKNGPHGSTGSSTSDHDLQMASVIEEQPILPDRVADAVASHMGPWYDGPEPETELQRVVHDADMLASTATVTPAIHGPVPEELADLGLEVIGE